MIEQNQNFNFMFHNQFNQNFSPQMFQNMNQNQFMMNNNSNQFNMVQNLDNLNNMVLMQQNQAMQGMINQMNYSNDNINPHFYNNNSCNNQNNNINIPINQIPLINSIISFYRQNDNNYMDYDNPNQIKNILNLINPNYSKLKYNNINQIEDPLYYIKAPKLTIKFINSNYLLYKVSIPKTITKYDLYTIGKLFKSDKTTNSNILLIYNNKIFDKDETPITFIQEEDGFIIIEPRNYPDDSYYKLLNKKRGDKMNIIISLNSGRSVNFVLPKNTTISEMIKAFNLAYGLENKYNKLLYNAKTLQLNDNRKIGDVIKNLEKIVSFRISDFPYVIGKSVVVHISYTEKNIEHWIFDIGLLNSIKYIINKVESFHNRKVEKIFVIGKVFDRNEDKCLSQIGIKDNFDCLVKFQKINAN